MKTLVILCVFIALGMAGCNTMSGLGKDVQNLGQGLQNAADDHNHK